MEKKFVLILLIFIFAFSLPEGNARTIVRGNPDWIAPSINGSILASSDGGTFRFRNGCFDVLDTNLTATMRRCWIVSGELNGVRFIFRSWAVNWTLRQGAVDANSAEFRESVIFNGIDMNVFATSRQGEYTKVRMEAKNGNLILTNLKLTYVFIPSDLNAQIFSNSNATFDYTRDRNFSGLMPSDLFFNIGNFSTTDLFDGGWNSTRLFVGSLNSFDNRIPDNNKFFGLETTIGNGTIIGGQRFRIGDTIQRFGNIPCNEDWNAGTTVDINANATVTAGCKLTIKPMVCVKYRSARQLTATATGSIIIADGNSTNPIVFTSVDHNNVASGNFVCDNIGISDGIPTDANYTVALAIGANSTGGRPNAQIAFANFFYAQTAISIGNMNASDANSGDWNNLRINNSTFGIFINSGNIVNLSISKSDFNARTYGIGFSTTISPATRNLRAITDSNFSCSVPRGCNGIINPTNITDTITTTITNIGKNRFDNVLSGILFYGNFDGLADLSTTTFSSINNNIFLDSNYGLRFLGNSQSNLNLNLFYSNICQRVGTCLDINATWTSGSIAGGSHTFGSIFNNLVEDSNSGFNFYFQGSGLSSASAIFSDLNNNTFRDMNQNGISIRMGALSSIDDTIMVFQNNVISDSNFGLNWINPNAYFGVCRKNAFFNNFSDTNGLTCAQSINLVANPFDIGFNHSSYLNHDQNSGSLLLNTGFGTPTDTNYLSQAVQSNYLKDIDGNTDMGFHSIAFDLNVRMVSPNNGTNFSSNPTFSIDFNVGSTALTKNDLNLDINIANFTSKNGFGVAIVKNATIANNTNFTCDTTNLNPITTCRFLWSGTASLSDTNVFIKVKIRQGTSTQFAFDSSDKNAFYQDVQNTTPTVLVLRPSDFNTLIGTQSIDFNLTDDQTATTQKIDINYSTVATRGTGTVIINDGNRATTTNLSCDSDVITTAKTCHYIWDTTTVIDGNYFILISSQDDSNAVGFDASNNSFAILNAVESTVSPPAGQSGGIAESFGAKIFINLEKINNNEWQLVFQTDTNIGIPFDYNVFADEELLSNGTIVVFRNATFNIIVPKDKQTLKVIVFNPGIGFKVLSRDILEPIPLPLLDEIIGFFTSFNGLIALVFIGTAVYLLWWKE